MKREKNESMEFIRWTQNELEYEMVQKLLCAPDR